MITRILSLAILVLVVTFLLCACSTSGKSILATDTPEPLPWVEGSLVNKETNQPISNARLVLCWQKDESTCTVKADLTALTNADGQFKIVDVPNGKYAILYNVSGNNLQSDLNNKILDYSPQVTSAEPGIGNVTHLMSSLGITSVSLCNAFYEVVNGNLVISGYVYAETTDIGLIFVGGDMVYVTIDDSPAKIDLKVWDTQNKDKCEGGEFNPLP